jgi:propionyl-CoA carboxylase beta chain
MGPNYLYAFPKLPFQKITLITRKAYGGAYDVMSSKHIGADINLAYPTAEIAVMGPEGAVNIIFRQKISDEEKASAVEDYRDAFANPYKAAELGFIDEVIYPRETRKKLITALEMSQNKSVSGPSRKHGNIRPKKQSPLRALRVPKQRLPSRLRLQVFQYHCRHMQMEP